MSHCILVVDDNPMDQMVAKAFLEKDEMLVVTASDGFEAIEILSEEGRQFDLVVIDLQMPKMPGLELLKRVKRQPQYKDLPILIMSARSAVKDVKLAIGSGAADYCVKPLDGLVFADKVKNLAKRSQTSWTEYELDPQRENTRGFFQSPLELISISEVGAKVRMPNAVNPGEVLSLEFEGLKQLGIAEAVIGKVSDVKKENDEWLVKLKFVGLTEKDSKVIRQFCRKGWALSNQELKHGSDKFSMLHLEEAQVQKIEPR